MYVHCMSWWCNSGSVFGNNLGQVVHTYVPLAQTSIISTSQRKVVLSGWEGNRRSGIALAIQWLIHLRAYGLRKGDEHSDLPGRLRLRSSFTQQLLVPSVNSRPSLVFCCSLHLLEHSTQRHSICTISFVLSPAAKDIPVSSILP